MSKTARLFTVIVPDFKGALSKRLEVRDTHLQNALKLKEKGILVLGGGYASEHPDDGKPFDFKGSILTFNLPTETDVRNILDADIYTKSGVWDLSKVQILPCIHAIK